MTYLALDTATGIARWVHSESSFLEDPDDEEVVRRPL